MLYHDKTDQAGRPRAVSPDGVGKRSHAGRLGCRTVPGGGRPPGRLPKAQSQGDQRPHDPAPPGAEGLSAARGKQGRAYVYRAAEPARSLAARAVRQIIDRLCKGSVEELVSGMVEAKVLSKGELDRLEEFVRDHRKGEEMKWNVWSLNSAFARSTDRRRGRRSCCAVLRIRTAAAQHAVWTGVLQRCCCSRSWLAWGPKAACRCFRRRGEPAVVDEAAPVSHRCHPAAPLEISAVSRAQAPTGTGAPSGLGVYLLGQSRCCCASRSARSAPAG